jgi:lipopolysaccharide export system protein LptA
VPDDVKEKAKEMLVSPEAAEMRQKALQAAQAAMQGNANAGTAEPQPGSVAAPSMTVVETPPPPAGPQPKLLQASPAPTKAAKGQILITAQKSSFFDVNESYGIFTGNVKARHPQMYIECEELEIWMAKQQGGLLGGAKPKPGSPAAKDSDILAPTKKKESAGTNIEKADARGPMVTVEKMTEDGEMQTGHCKHLIYDGKTEVTTLLDWPQVQVGNKLHQATEPGCVMIIDKKGKLTTTGGHRTIVLQDDETAPAGSGAVPPPQQ